MTYHIVESSAPPCTSFRSCGRGTLVAVRGATATRSVHGVVKEWRGTAHARIQLGPESWWYRRAHLLLVVHAIHWRRTVGNNTLAVNCGKQLSQGRKATHSEIDLEHNLQS